jgi:hypothetical protein
MFKFNVIEIFLTVSMSANIGAPLCCPSQLIIMLSRQPINQFINADQVLTPKPMVRQSPKNRNLATGRFASVANTAGRR